MMRHPEGLGVNKGRNGKARKFVSTMVELHYIKLGWVVCAAKQAGVGFSLTYAESDDSYYFTVNSPAKGECTVTKNRDFDQAVDDVLEWLKGLRKSA